MLFSGNGHWCLDGAVWLLCVSSLLQWLGVNHGILRCWLRLRLLHRCGLTGELFQVSIVKLQNTKYVKCIKLCHRIYCSKRHYTKHSNITHGKPYSAVSNWSNCQVGLYVSNCWYTNTCKCLSVLGNTSMSSSNLVNTTMKSHTMSVSMSCRSTWHSMHKDLITVLFITWITQFLLRTLITFLVTWQHLWVIPYRAHQQHWI